MLSMQDNSINIFIIIILNHQLVIIKHNHKSHMNIVKWHFYVWTQWASLTHIRWCHGDSNQYTPCNRNNLTTRHTWATTATRVATFYDDYQRVRIGSYLDLVPSSMRYVTDPPLKKQGFVSQDPTGGFSMKRECVNTHISIQYHDIQVIKRLLHIKCHVLWFTEDEAQKMLQQIYQSFCGSDVSHDKHTLFTLEESGPPRSTYTCESQ
jgi:hypothetical protein